MSNKYRYITLMSSAFLTNVLKRHDILMSNENLALTCHAVIASLRPPLSTLNILFDGWVREILWPRFAINSHNAS